MENMGLLIAFTVILVIVVQTYSAELVDPLFQREYNHMKISGISSKRAVESSRGRKHFDPEEDGFFDDFGFKKGQYFGEKDKTDIQNKIPGEPRIDYAAYLKTPKTKFSCIGRSQGYYADEETGCQVFHVCDDDQISSFLCPVGLLFSQQLLTCDWWSQVACSQSRQFDNDIRKNDLKKIPLKKNYVKSENFEATLNHFDHARHTVHTKVKDDSRRMLNNQLKEFRDNKIFKDSPIVRIVTLPKSITTFKSREYSSLNETRQDNPNSKSNQHSSSSSSSANSTTTANEQSNTLQNKHNSVISPVQSLKDLGFESEVANDMEGIESIGLIGAHFERDLEMTDNQFVEEIDSTTDIIVMDRRTGKSVETITEATNRTNASKPIKIVPKLDESEQDDRVLNITEMSGGVTIIIQEFESPRDTTRDNQVSTAQLADHTINSSEFTTQGINGNVDKRYKTQHIHKISGFKINNKPPEIQGNSHSDAIEGRFRGRFNEDQGSRTNDHEQIIVEQKKSETRQNNHYKQDIDLTKYRVNYHTHYYPEMILKHKNNQRSADIDINNNNKMDIQSRRNEQAMDYYDYQHYDNVKDNDNTYCKSFGTPIYNKNEQFSKIIKNTAEFSRDAHKINSELQEKSANILWVIPQAIANNGEQLPRPYYYNHKINVDPNGDDDKMTDESLTIQSPLIDYNVDLTSVTEEAAGDGSKTKVQTEFIPSLGFDFSNDEEKKKYYENVQQETITIIN